MPLPSAAGAVWPSPAPASKDLLRTFAGVRSARFAAAVSWPSPACPPQPSVYYFGATGGGVWKTTDGGVTWIPVSDGQFATGSVGAIAVAESDPNVIYVGMGEACMRGNASNGDGVYKSIDAGKTWNNVGLQDTLPHRRGAHPPANPDIVYVAALGHLWGPNEQRGVFRIHRWRRRPGSRCSRAAPTPARSISSIDPTNPTRALRRLLGGAAASPGSSIAAAPAAASGNPPTAATLDRSIRTTPACRAASMGRIGVTVSPANPERVWAIVEAADGGVFRSDNGGRHLDQRQRPERSCASAPGITPTSSPTRRTPTPSTALNVGFYRSIDGGRTFDAIRAPHGDNHDLWIAPNDPQRMIESNDGGANVTNDGGRTWSTQHEPAHRAVLPRGARQRFPLSRLRRAAGQHHRAHRQPQRGGGITEHDWYDVGGGESGWIAPDPRDSQIVYAGSYGGLITR